MRKISVNSNIKILFFTPHADDIELGVPFMYLEALRLGNQVIEVVMTGNEYGTLRDEFKGKRLRKIREFELLKANSVFENASKNKIKVIRMGFIDGHLPLNKDSLIDFINLINREKPTIIFAPDPWYSQDFHSDHLNTGRLVYFSMRNKSIKFRPKAIFYYYSSKTHYYIQCRWHDFKIIENATKQHRSQYSPIQSKFIINFYNKLSILRHFLETGKFSESFRKQKFNRKGIPLAPKTFTNTSFRERILYYLFSNTTIGGFVKFYNRSPEKIGLKINYNNYDLVKSKDKRYEFPYQTKRRN